MSTNEMPARVSWAHVSATLLLMIGLMLIGLSFVWPTMASSQSAWPNEKAEAYQAASANVHRLSMQMAGRTPQDQTRAHHEELANAQTNYAALRTELDEARIRPARIATILRYSGILLAAGGAVWLFARRETSTADA
jgi:hypothetical protein